MQTQYQAKDKVLVFDGPFWRAEAEHGNNGAPASASRAAVIERQMPDADDYEVTFTDGAEPAQAFVDVHVLMLASDVKAAKAARAERAAKAAAALVAEAQKIAAAGQE